MEEPTTDPSTCWYCGQPSDQLSVVPWPVHRRLPPQPGDAYNLIRWETAVVAVPRCASCTRKRTILTIIGAVLSGIYPLYFIVYTQVALVTGQEARSVRDWLLGLAGPVVVGVFMFALTMGLLAWPGRLVARLMKTRLIPVSQPLRELRRQGWRPGSKPGNVKQITSAQ